MKNFLIIFSLLLSLFAYADEKNLEVGTQVKFNHAVTKETCPGNDGQVYFHQGKVECKPKWIESSCLVTITYNVRAGQVCTVIESSTGFIGDHNIMLSPQATCPSLTCMQGTAAAPYYDGVTANKIKDNLGNLVSLKEAESITYIGSSKSDSSDRHNYKGDTGDLIIRRRTSGAGGTHR